jgi:hypothetical protein
MLHNSYSYKHRIMSSPKTKAKPTLGGTLVAGMASESSASSAESLERRGCLNASVLSVYDLPYSDDVPKAVTLSACGMTVGTGPPLARHKDRNSFRFAPSADSSVQQEPTKLVASLRDLYQSTLKVRVAYSDPDKYLEAELPLKQLRIHEQKWLILNLSPPPVLEESGEAAASASAEEDVSQPPTIRIKFQLSGP